MGSTQPHLPTIPPATPVHRFPPIRPRILLPLVVGMLAVAAAVSSLLMRSLGRAS